MRMKIRIKIRIFAGGSGYCGVEDTDGMRMKIRIKIRIFAGRIVSYGGWGWGIVDVTSSGTTRKWSSRQVGCSRRQFLRREGSP
jgi:hypothetical protein